MSTSSTRCNYLSGRALWCAGCRLLVPVAALLFVLSGPWHGDASQPRPEFEIKLATLAPENSSLMHIFREMDSTLRQETDGRVGFKIFAGFALGDEYDVLRKMRIGLVHAGTFTHTTLTNVNPDLRVLQVPFLFNNHKEVDYILERMGGYFKEGFAEHGYQVLGWSELGFIYMMATFPVSSVSDLEGKKVWTTANSPMANALFAKAGVSPVPISPPDVLVALQTNLLDVVYNSPYYALVTQWYSRIKYIIDLPLAYIGGGLIIHSKTFSRLPATYQETMREVCADYLRRLTEKTREDNREALDIILKRGVQLVQPEPGGIERFQHLNDQVIEELDPELLPRDVLRRLRSELAEYRKRHRERP
ncbi:MAG: TRAP transporter substrate-binding protein DctP [Syntrophobacteria bacterium]